MIALQENLQCATNRKLLGLGSLLDARLQKGAAPPARRATLRQKASTMRLSTWWARWGRCSCW